MMGIFSDFHETETRPKQRGTACPIFLLFLFLLCLCLPAKCPGAEKTVWLDIPLCN